ncbi:MAG TPA: SDR family oxidoreductase [Chloroflexota bacterium]|jgi:dTDP-4-dehydrorhamnose reductase|nr:SDR family oxidoreductase [Chloroflexota bacterium]
MTRRVLVIGASGMLGHKLWQVLSPRYDTLVAARAAYDDFASLGIFEASRWYGGVDAGQVETLLRVVRSTRPDVIVNCVGVIKQRPEAQDPITAIRINALYPHQLYEIAGAAGAHLVHVSTDCVFSGSRGQYSEGDVPDPPDLYGRSKALGEIDAPGCLTLRTSIIGRELRSSYGLIEWFLSQSGGAIRGYARAIYTGLPTIIFAELLAELLARPTLPSGLLQLASEPISKYDLLLLARDAYGVDVEIDRDEAYRCDRSLTSHQFREATGLVAPPWPEMIRRMAADPTPYPSWRTNRWT